MDKKQILKEFRRLAGLPLEEQYYESRKDLEGYIDADELIGKRLWFHTNRTHRNQGKNGMVGITKLELVHQYISKHQILELKEFPILVIEH
jgi:hypothetical protein